MFNDMKNFAKQLESSVPNKHDQLRMIALGALLNNKPIPYDIPAIVKEADDIAKDLVKELEKY